MKFLPHEGDDVLTLHEALAFIQPSDDTNRNSATFPPLEEIDELLGSMIESSPKDANSHEEKVQNPTTTKKKKNVTRKKTTGEKTTVKKKRVRSPASSSTVLQRRKKAEILSLREESTDLQKMLNQLLSSDPDLAILKLNAKTYADSKARGQKLSHWHRSAFEQFEMRYKSQKLNLQLKKLLAQQLHTSESLRRIFQRQSLVQDMSFLMKQQSPARFRPSFADNDLYRCMAQLENAAENIYQQSTPKFEARSAPYLSSSMQMQTSYKEQRTAEVVEFVVSTPMNCSMADASDVVWSLFQKEQTPGSKSNVLQKLLRYRLTHLEDTLDFEKLQYVRKFSEPEKVTVVYSNVVLLRSKGLKLCSKGYTTIMPLPANACVVHSVLKLRVDNEAGHQTFFAEDVALGALSKALRFYWQEEQSRLIEEAARVSGGSSYFEL